MGALKDGLSLSILKRCFDFFGFTSCLLLKFSTDEILVHVAIMKSPLVLLPPI